MLKIKDENDGNLKLKEDIVLQGQRDEEKNEIRKDCESADMIIVRMTLFLAICLNLVIGAADIEGELMKSGPITREVFVPPPHQLEVISRTLWKILNFPNGLVN